MQRMTQARTQTQMNSGLSVLLQLLLEALAFACVEPVQNLLSLFRRLPERSPGPLRPDAAAPEQRREAPLTHPPLIPTQAGTQRHRMDGRCMRRRTNHAIKLDFRLRGNQRRVDWQEINRAERRSHADCPYERVQNLNPA